MVFVVFVEDVRDNGGAVRLSIEAGRREKHTHP